MKTKILVIFLMIALKLSFAEETPGLKLNSLFGGGARTEKAVATTQEAILAYPEVKHAKKQIEYRIYRQLPVSQSAATAIGSTVVSASNGEVNTKVIKKMDVKMLGGKLRPDAKYNWIKKDLGTSAQFTWSF